jgi:predicted RNA-binding Zn ribbon-like protein
MQNQSVRDGFFFLGDHAALDFLNTKPLQKGQAQELLSDFLALLRWFVAARFVDGTAAARFAVRWSGSRQADVALARILAFRESLRSGVLAVESGGKLPRRVLDEVNDLVKEHPASFQLVNTGRKLTKKIAVSPATPGDLVGIVANAAADLFCDVDRTRIRQCETCVIHFCDTTKNRTRRWCSMQVCGNRAKVAAYAARKRREKAKKNNEDNA